MYEAVQQCKHCGAGLSLEDLRQPNCRFCKTVFPHHAQAAQHAQVVSQVMGQMMQQQVQIVDAWRGGFGVGPTPPGPPGGPPPGAPVHPGAFQSPGVSQANAIVRTILILVAVSVAIILVVVGAGMFFAISR